MAKGGKKQPWKVKGRKPVRKMYQDYCREQHKKGLVSNGQGGWMSASQIRDSVIKTGYEKMIARL